MRGDSCIAVLRSTKVQRIIVDDFCAASPRNKLQKQTKRSWVPTIPAITMFSFSVTETSMTKSWIHSPTLSTWAGLQGFACAFTRGTLGCACASRVIATTWNYWYWAWAWAWTWAIYAFLTAHTHARMEHCIRCCWAKLNACCEGSAWTAGWCWCWHRRWWRRWGWARCW